MALEPSAIKLLTSSFWRLTGNWKNFNLYPVGYGRTWDKWSHFKNSTIKRKAILIAFYTIYIMHCFREVYWEKSHSNIRWTRFSMFWEVYSLSTRVDKKKERNYHLLFSWQSKHHFLRYDNYIPRKWCSSSKTNNTRLRVFWTA